MRATARGLLTYLDKELDWVLIPSKRETIKRLWNRQSTSLTEEIWKAYYASSVRDGVDKLTRKGQVEVRETKEGTEVRITEKGKTERLKYRLGDLVLGNSGVWDGKWRLVFFDVGEMERGRRDMFRRWIKRLGLKQMQKSVFITPWECEKEVKFLREVAGVPHGVKMVLAEKIDNELDLKEWFDL